MVKKGLKLLLVNALVLGVLLVVLEMVLRWAGVDTVVEMERREPGWRRRYRAISQALDNGTLEFQDSYRTDNEGMFRANPDYFRAHDGTVVNEDGFRGRPFEVAQTPPTRILLIGDSFVWGAGAQPLTNCFADLLEAAGYGVYNAGIPGTDPQQYALVAEKYAGILKPDLVAVCVYMGNDGSTRPLLVRPNKPLHYVTNAGWLLGYDDRGRFFENQHEVVEYLKRKCGYCPTAWDYFTFKTVIGRIVTRTAAMDRRLAFPASKQWVRDALQRVENTCVAQGVPYMVFLVPSVNQDAKPQAAIVRNIRLFNGLHYIYPDPFERSDYRDPPNNHFNNKGHRKYADFMIGVLKAKGFEPGGPP